MDSDHFFEKLAAETDTLAFEAERAPARLKSSIYSTLVEHLAATGPLRTLSETRDAGRALCIFEAALCAAPVGPRVESMNPLPRVSRTRPRRAHGIGSHLLAALPLRSVPAPMTSRGQNARTTPTRF